MTPSASKHAGRRHFQCAWVLACLSWMAIGCFNETTEVVQTVPGPDSLEVQVVDTSYGYVTLSWRYHLADGRKETYYDLRYSTDRQVVEAWVNAPQARDVPSRAADQRELHTILLDGGVEYFFAVRSWEDYGIKKYVSNIVSATPQEDVAVSFQDGNLDQAIRSQVGIPTGVLMASDLRVVSQLDVAGVTDISGLRYCKNLTTLTFGSGSSIADLQDLASLQELTSLDAQRCDIEQLGPLAGLVQLQTLRLSFNNITDLTPLSSLANLDNLTLTGNQIQDASPLNGLPLLRRLILSTNPLGNIAGLTDLPALQFLTLSVTSMNTLAPLSAFPNLEGLALGQNQFADLTPLTGLTKLRYLYVNNNQIEDISPLSAMTSLETAWLHSNQITSIEALQYLPSLSSVNLSENQVVDLRPLVENVDFASGFLDVRNNPLSDASINEHIPTLTSRGIEVRR